MITARRLLLILGLLGGSLAFGTLGFYWIEGWRLFDAFYMALITLSTVGYAELHPLSEAGRLFASVLILVGVTVTLVSITLLGDFIIKLELADYFGHRRNKRMLGKVKNHYIVCGLGRVGHGVIGELQYANAPIIAIDKDPDAAGWASDQGIPTLVGDSTEDATLIEAHIKEAKGLVAALSSDADNVYVTLSARGLNADLLIAARATNESAEEKLRRAGATTVLTPYTYIGHRLAQSMLRPHVLSFLDIATVFRKSDLELEFEQIRVSESSRVAGKSIEDSKLRDDYGVIVLALVKPDGDTQFNPRAKTRIEGRDVLIAMGERAKLQRLEAELEGRPL